tara:strand:+ start:265 stop:2136 length:1872 start_codon:yes stop_codon:yes gene_type:complete
MPKRSNYIDLTDNKRTRMEEDDATTGESNFDEDSIMDVDDNSQKLIDEIVDFHKQKRNNNNLSDLKFAFNSTSMTAEKVIRSVGFLGAKKGDWFIVYGNDDTLNKKQGIVADRFEMIQRGTVVECTNENPVEWQDIKTKKNYTLKPNPNDYLIHLSKTLKETIEEKKNRDDLLERLENVEGPANVFDIRDIANTLVSIQNPTVQEQQNAELLNSIGDLRMPLDDYIDMMRSSVPDDATRRTDKIEEAGITGKIAEREFEEENRDVFEFMRIVNSEQTPVNSQLTDYDDDNTISEDKPKTIYDLWKVFSPMNKINEVIQNSERLQQELDLEELENAFQNFTLESDQMDMKLDIDEDEEDDVKPDTTNNNESRYRNVVIQMGVYLKYIGKTIQFLFDKETIKAGGLTTLKALLSLLQFTTITLFNGLKTLASSKDGRTFLAYALIPYLGYHYGIDTLLYVCKVVANGSINYIIRLLDAIRDWFDFDKDVIVDMAIEILSSVLIKSGVADAFTQFAEAAATNTVNTELAVSAIQTSAEAMADTSAATMNLIMDLNQAEQNNVINGVFSQLTGLAVEGVRQYITNGGKAVKKSQKRRTTLKKRKKNTKRAKKTNNSRKKRTIKKSRK